VVTQLEAQLKADQGAIDNARAYLDWTTIGPPIDGRLGIRLVDPGNLLRAMDATGIVTVTQLRPMAVVFKPAPAEPAHRQRGRRPRSGAG
jgi:multidrug efflux system membrane fusion protein